MPSIFVSYRRTDAPGHAGRIYDRLVERFGRDNVFMDLDSTTPGADFAEVISDTIGRCDAVVVVIGRDWTAATAPGRSARRLDNPDDWVRREIAVALARNIRVVPVLVEGARMPAQEELPDEMVGLARRHAVELAETAWSPQLGQLIESLAASSPRSEATRHIGRPRRRPASRRLRTPATVVVLCAIAVGAAAAIIVRADNPGKNAKSAAGAPGALTADEYRLRLARICVEHENEANQVVKVQPDSPVLTAMIPIERGTTDRIRALHPPNQFEPDHRSVLALWGRRISVLSYYYDRLAEEGDNPSLLQDLKRDMDTRVTILSDKIRKRFAALDVMPECDFF